MGKLLGETEDVPSAKKYMISTRDNSDYKWQDRGVIGALEVPSEPDLELRGEYIPRHVRGHEELFDQALELWNQRKWRDGFIEACENVPKATFCCGLLPDDDQTIRDIQQKLTKGWIKALNQILRSERKDFLMDVFIWQWHNATGKSLTLILLIRFLESPRLSMLHEGESQELQALARAEMAEHKSGQDTDGQVTVEEEKEPSD
ncbi:hypothetical protein ACA910_003771 [Epithemia clementina (nom. ined.)]